MKIKKNIIMNITEFFDSNALTDEKFQHIKNYFFEQYPICDEYVEPEICCGDDPIADKAHDESEMIYYDDTDLIKKQYAAFFEFVVSMANVKHKMNVNNKKLYKKTDEVISKYLNKSFIYLERIWDGRVVPERMYLYDFDEKWQEFKYVVIEDDDTPLGHSYSRTISPEEFFTVMLMEDDVRNMFKYSISTYKHSIKNLEKQLKSRQEQVCETEKELDIMQAEYDKAVSTSEDDLIEKLMNFY